MYYFGLMETEAFTVSSIVEVDAVADSRLEGIDEPSALIESFLQPYPLRDRRLTLMEGEKDQYG